MSASKITITKCISSKGVATRRNVNLGSALPSELRNLHLIGRYDITQSQIILFLRSHYRHSRRYDIFSFPTTHWWVLRNKVIPITRFITVERLSARHSLGLIRSPGIYRECRARTKKTIERGTSAISRSHASSVDEQVLVRTKENPARNIAMVKRKCAGVTT